MRNAVNTLIFSVLFICLMYELAWLYRFDIHDGGKVVFDRWTGQVFNAISNSNLEASLENGTLGQAQSLGTYVEVTNLNTRANHADLLARSNGETH